MSISSDEVNFLVYRYLQENGFAHSAFTFAYESLVVKSSAAQTEIPPGALITFLQKGLEYIAIEEHISEDGTVQEFENNYSLLSPVICDAVAVKEDRRNRANIPSVSSASNLAAAAGGSHMSSIPASSSSNKNAGNSHKNSSAGELAPLDSESAMNRSSSQSSIHISSQEQGNRILHLRGHQGEVFMCSWSPGGRRQLASGSSDGVCRLWGLGEMDAHKWSSAAGTEIKVSTSILPHCSLEGEKLKDVTSITWSPDGEFVATGCYDGTSRIWNSNGTLVTTFKEHAGPVFSLKWNKTGKYILSGSFDKRAIVWTPEGEIVRVVQLHDGPVLDVDWKNADTFATCSSDRTIFICNVISSDPAEFIRSFVAHSDEVNAISWSPGGRYLATCSDDTTAKIWTVEDGLKWDLRGHKKEIFSLKWTPTGPGSANESMPLYLCTASFDGSVKVWDVATGLATLTLARYPQPVYCLSPSPDGKWLASGSLGGNVAVWSLDDGSLIKELKGDGDTFDVSWSSDCSLLSSCFASGNLLVMDTSNIASAPVISAAPGTVVRETQRDVDAQAPLAESNEIENNKDQLVSEPAMSVDEDGAMDS